MKEVCDEVFALSNIELTDHRKSEGGVPVIGEGSLDANIMVIGEAPGKKEAETGKPFCGRSGKMLDQLFVSIGVSRDEVYITNIVKDRPPKNRDPLPEEIALYGPFLDRQIDIIKPKVLVTLGRFSMEYILKKYNLESELEPISKAHGKQYEALALHGRIDIVPLYHPAAAIYNRSLIETLTEDFKILKKYGV